MLNPSINEFEIFSRLGIATSNDTESRCLMTGSVHLTHVVGSAHPNLTHVVGSAHPTCELWPARSGSQDQLV